MSDCVPLAHSFLGVEHLKQIEAFVHKLFNEHGRLDKRGFQVRRAVSAIRETINSGATPVSDTRFALTRIDDSRQRVFCCC